jgi:biopolymer transport protein ExbB
LNPLEPAFLTFLIAQTAEADEQKGASLLTYITGGGLIGWIIVALSVLAVCLVVIHSIQIRRISLLPPAQVVAIRDLLTEGRVDATLDYCNQASNDSFLTRILSPGLTRFLRSPFGAFEIKQAIEEAGQEQAARLYRTTDALGIIGTVAPLLGLLGTVQGMIGAFDTVASSAVNDANYYEALAGNISLALITTMQGLIVAIPCVTLFTVFRNRIDAIASEAGQELDRMVLLLESAGEGAAGGVPGMPRPAAVPGGAAS